VGFPGITRRTLATHVGNPTCQAALSLRLLSPSAWDGYRTWQCIAMDRTFSRKYDGRGHVLQQQLLSCSAVVVAVQQQQCEQQQKRQLSAAEQCSSTAGCGGPCDHHVPQPPWRSQVGDHDHSRVHENIVFCTPTTRCGYNMLWVLLPHPGWSCLAAAAPLVVVPSCSFADAWPHPRTICPSACTCHPP
jgi:hypothetical protein